MRIIVGHDIMFDLGSYAQGWIDWNLLVDHEGGPNHLGKNSHTKSVLLSGLDALNRAGTHNSI